PPREGPPQPVRRADRRAARGVPHRGAAGAGPVDRAPAGGPRRPALRPGDPGTRLRAALRPAVRRGDAEGRLPQEVLPGDLAAHPPGPGRGAPPRRPLPPRLRPPGRPAPPPPARAMASRPGACLSWGEPTHVRAPARSGLRTG